MAVTICTPDESCRNGRIGELYVYNNFQRQVVEEVSAGDICALSGLPDASIGETVCYQVVQSTQQPFEGANQVRG